MLFTLINSFILLLQSIFYCQFCFSIFLYLYSFTSATLWSICLLLGLSVLRHYKHLDLIALLFYTHSFNILVLIILSLLGLLIFLFQELFLIGGWISYFFLFDIILYYGLYSYIFYHQLVY